MHLSLCVRDKLRWCHIARALSKKCKDMVLNCLQITGKLWKDRLIHVPISFIYYKWLHSSFVIEEWPRACGPPNRILGHSYTTRNWRFH